MQEYSTRNSLNTSYACIQMPVKVSLGHHCPQTLKARSLKLASDVDSKAI